LPVFQPPQQQYFQQQQCVPAPPVWRHVSTQVQYQPSAVVGQLPFNPSAGFIGGAAPASFNAGSFGLASPASFNAGSYGLAGPASFNAGSFGPAPFNAGSGQVSFNAGSVPASFNAGPSSAASFPSSAQFNGPPAPQRRNLGSNYFAQQASAQPQVSQAAYPSSNQFSAPPISYQSNSNAAVASANYNSNNFSSGQALSTVGDSSTFAPNPSSYETNVQYSNNFSSSFPGQSQAGQLIQQQQHQPSSYNQQQSQSSTLRPQQYQYQQKQQQQQPIPPKSIVVYRPSINKSSKRYTVVA
jgi:hypothetical protein